MCRVQPTHLTSISTKKSTFTSKWTKMGGFVRVERQNVHFLIQKSILGIQYSCTSYLWTSQKVFQNCRFSTQFSYFQEHLPVAIVYTSQKVTMTDLANYRYVLDYCFYKNEYYLNANIQNDVHSTFVRKNVRNHTLRFKTSDCTLCSGKFLLRIKFLFKILAILLPKYVWSIQD